MFLRKKAASANCDQCGQRTVYVVFHDGLREQFCREHYLIHRRQQDSHAETGAPETRDFGSWDQYYIDPTTGADRRTR